MASPSENEGPYKQSLERKTQGVHRVALFPNGQLGSEEDTVNEAAMSTLDMSVLAINNLAPFSPTLSVLTLPYIVRNADEARTLVLVCANSSPDTVTCLTVFVTR